MNKQDSLKKLLDQGVITVEAYNRGMAKLGVTKQAEVKIESKASEASELVPGGPKTLQSDGKAKPRIVTKVHKHGSIDFDVPEVDVKDIEERAKKIAATPKQSQAYLDALKAMDMAKDPSRQPGGAQRANNASFKALREKGFLV